MEQTELINWLLAGDVSIQCQTQRDLLDQDQPDLQSRIATEGWGAQLLSFRKPDGYWGKNYYQPKWISTHYTLLDLKNLNIHPENPAIRESIDRVFREEKGPDGGIYPISTGKISDVCVNGMVLNYASYFKTAAENLKSIVDFLLRQQMPDGGFNCMSNRAGAVHSSLHTSLSVIEGIHEYHRNGYQYRLPELLKAEADTREFILQHHLYRSDKTGAVIKPGFLRLCYPGRWFYDILKAMDYFQAARAPYDARMEDALQQILGKRTKSGQWKLASPHSGLTYFDMEKAGAPSRWNTLRALRVMRFYKSDL